MKLKIESRFALNEQMKPDISKVDEQILRTSLAHPEMLADLPVRGPRYESRFLTMEEVQRVLLHVSTKPIENGPRIDSYDDELGFVSVIGTCGSVLYVSSRLGSACIDIPNGLVPGTEWFQ